MGSPQGSLALWTKKETSSTWEQLKNTSDIQNSNCTYIANLTETYTLTRQDNGVVFRCSSQNQYTREPALATEIGPLEVLCKLSSMSMCHNKIKKPIANEIDIFYVQIFSLKSV